MFFCCFPTLLAPEVLATQWARTYGGGEGESEASAVQPTPDGGYILAATTYSWGVGYGTNFWVLKLDAGGSITWQKTYGSVPHDDIRAVQWTADGGYVVSGVTNSTTGLYDAADAWVLKLDANGNILWQKSFAFATKGVDDPKAIQPTADGGIVVAGLTNYATSPIAEVQFAWVMKLDASGNIAWQRTYGDTDGTASAHAIQPTPDGGYIVAGETTLAGGGAWALKLDANGNIVWQKTYRGAGGLDSVQRTSDGGYIVAGYVGTGAWVAKLDASGNIDWQKAYSSSSIVRAYSIQLTVGGGYIVAGAGAGAFVMKLDGTGNIISQRNYRNSGYDVARSVQVTPDGGYVVAGVTEVSGWPFAWVLKVDSDGAIPGCASMVTSNVTATNADATAVNSTATGLTGSAMAVNTSAAAEDSYGTSLQQCYYSGPALSANFQGLWWKAPANSESGWGINFAHQGDVIFATWYTYDLSGKAWWLSMTANKSAENVYSGTLYKTTGPPFNAQPFDPNRVTRTPMGTGTLTFTGARSGSFAYTVNGVSQTKAIVPQEFGALPTCVWGAQPDLTKATNYQDLWWASPPESESGWGVNFAHQGDKIFATWYTYDLDGTPLWLSATTPKTFSGTYTGTLYRTTGPAFNADPFDPNAVTRTPVGTLTLTFTNGNAASYTYTVTLPGTSLVTQTKQVQRQVFRAPGTVCQ